MKELLLLFPFYYKCLRLREANRGTWSLFHKAYDIVTRTGPVVSNSVSGFRDLLARAKNTKHAFMTHKSNSLMSSMFFHMSRNSILPTDLNDVCEGQSEYPF